MPNIQSYNSKKISRLTANRSKYFMPITAFVAVVIIGFAGVQLFQKITGKQLEFSARFIKTTKIRNTADLEKFNAEYDAFTEDFNAQEPPSSIFQ